MTTPDGNFSIEDHVMIKNPLKVIRNFGRLIKKLSMSLVDLDEKFHNEIEKYLSIYSSDTLQRLVLRCSLKQIPLKFLTKPLKKVTYLHIRRDDYKDNSYTQLLEIEKNVPALNEIEITSLSKYVREPGKVHFQNIESFTLNCHPIKYEEYPFSFGNLKHFTLYGCCIVNDALLECIGHIKDLKTLKITYIGSCLLSLDSFRKLLELKNVRSTVVKMKILYNECLSPDDVLHFLEQCRSLQKFNVGVVIRKDSNERTRLIFIQTILNNLSANWKYHLVTPAVPGNFVPNMSYVFERVTDSQ